MRINRHVSINISKPKKDQEHLQDRTPDSKPAPSSNEKSSFNIINKPAMPGDVSFALSVAIIAGTVVTGACMTALTLHYIDTHPKA